MGRVEPPLAGDEAAAVLGELERLRSYLAWKCGGLDSAGLLKHVAHVEDTHFVRLLLAAKPGPPWDAVNWDTDPDWDWSSAANDTPDQLMSLWEQSVERSRVLVAEALADDGLDHLGRYVTRSGESPNLRRILLDMIEEYARHVGHADLIRESVDGLTGEDPDD